MTSLDTKALLAALSRATSTGSKLAITGTAAAVSSALLVWLRQSGQDLNLIKFLGIPIPVPEAIVGFAILSGASGWAAWAYLRQGLKFMHRLEFDIGVEPEEIKAALTGSSLASASVLLLRMLCFSQTIVLTLSLPELSVVTVMVILGNKIGISNTYLAASITLVTLPYLLVVLMPRLRYLNPDNWANGNFIFSLYLRTKESAYSPKTKLAQIRKTLPEVAKEIDVEKFYREIESALPTILSESMHKMFRKSPFRYLLSDATDNDFDAEYCHGLVKKAASILMSDFPHKPLEKREEIGRWLLIL